MLKYEEEEIDKLDELGIQILPCKISQNGYCEIDRMMKRKQFDDHLEREQVKLAGDKEILILSGKQIVNHQKKLIYWKVDSKVESDDQVKQFVEFGQLLDSLHQ